MNWKIGRSYIATALFEISVSIKGESYLVIYGEHINGYFCCVPSEGWGCEMAESSDTRFNTAKLQSCGAEKEIASCIAEAIKNMCADS